MDEIKDRLDKLPSDEALLVKLALWEKESDSYYNELKRVQDKNEQYYLGNQTERDRVRDGLSNIVQNRIFEATETALPIITSQPAQFLIQVDENSEVAVQQGRQLQIVLGNFYIMRDMAGKMEMAYRHEIIDRFGVLEVYWDESIDDINVRYVRPQHIRMPKFGLDAEKLPYLCKRIDMTYQEVFDFFGATVANDLAKSASADRAEPSNNYDNVYTVDCYWTDWWVAYKSQNKILKKEMNPYYDFETVENNLLEKPAKPFFFLTEFTLGRTPVGETSLLEQAMPIQDGINALNRIITNNAIRMGNGTWLIDSTTMAKEEADQITNEPGLKIYGNNVANPNFVRRDAPPGLPPYIFNLLQHYEDAFDNIFGLHSTTRGERQPGRETYKGRALLKQGDTGRLDKLVRGGDRVIAAVGNYVVQLMKLNYDEPRDIPLMASADGQEVIQSFSNSEIPDRMKVFVKSGSTLPNDEITKADKATELWQMGGIDPITLYKELKFANPEKMAEDLMKWKTGQLIPGMTPPPVEPGAGSQEAPPAAPVPTE